MEYSRQDHYRDVSEDGEDTSNIHALRCYVYTRHEEQLIKRFFDVCYVYTVKGGVVCTLAKDDIINQKQQCEAIGLRGFDYKLFEEQEFGGIRDGLDRYPYLNHPIQLWLGCWVKHMAKKNLEVGNNNRLDTYGDNKWLVCPFRSQNFRECVR